MGLMKKMKLVLYGIKDSIKRFPITIGLSTTLAVLLIYLNESNLIGDSRVTLDRIALVLGLSIPLSLCIGLLSERFFRDKKGITYIIYILGVGYLILFYFGFLETFDKISMYRYVGNMLFFLIAFLYIPRLKREDKFEYYIMDVFSAFALTFIYSFVLYFGVAAILFTINQLFDANIRGEIFSYMFLIVFFVFAVALFLSKLPPIEAKYKENIFTKSLNILLLYIVIPLITIYTGILYVYFAKILITRSWPRGLVSHLVLWYSTISVGVIFLITPILEENKLANMFKTLFPKIILPILLMMFASIYIRVGQYGITENRYFLIVLGLWVFGIMIYFSIKRPLKNILIPISLSIIVLISVFGPLSSFAVSRYSQNERLENILIKNNMLINGEIVKNPDISLIDKREISNIVSYFNSNHSLEDIKTLPKDFNIDDMESLMGFKYDPDYGIPGGRDNYFSYHINTSDEIIDVSGYDYYLILNSWNESKREVGDLIIEFNRQENKFLISIEDTVLLEQDINELVNDVYEKQTEKNLHGIKGIVSMEDMTYDIDINNIRDVQLRLIFTNIAGRFNEDQGVVTESVDFILLINN